MRAVRARSRRPHAAARDRRRARGRLRRPIVRRRRSSCRARRRPSRWAWARSAPAMPTGSHRFGEFLAVSGAAAYLPADGTECPTTWWPRAPRRPSVRVSRGLVCDGAFERHLRFECTDRGGVVPLADVAAVCLELSRSDAAAVVMMAETAAPGRRGAPDVAVRYRGRRPVRLPRRAPAPDVHGRARLSRVAGAGGRRRAEALAARSRPPSCGRSAATAACWATSTPRRSRSGRSRKGASCWARPCGRCSKTRACRACCTC